MAADPSSVRLALRQRPADSPTVTVLMFAIMFGLSVDYQLFLLSRIRERHDVTGDNTAAIAVLLLVIVIGSFSFSSITFIKLLGVGAK